MPTKTASFVALPVPLAPPPPSCLVTDPILPTLARLAVPNMAAMLAMALVTIAETSYVGLLGISALAGMALAFPVVMLQQMLSGGAIGSSIASAVSRAVGAGDEPKARALAHHATLIGLAGGLISTVAMLAGGATIYRLLGGRGDALAQALAYSDMVFLGATGIWLTNTSSSVLRGYGDVRTPMRVALATAILQVPLSGALGLGLGPFPRLGMTGVALGQVIAYGCGALFLLWYLARSGGRARLFREGFAPSRSDFAAIMKVGAVAAISPFQTVLCALIVTRLVAAQGSEALAGYGIGARLEFLLIPVVFALGSASVPMVGMAMGAGLVARARTVAWTASGMAACVLGTIGLVVALAPNAWTRLFSDAPAVLASAASYFAWAGPSYAFYGMGLCLYFASQGAGRVLGPVLAGTVRLAIVAAGGWWISATQAPAWMLFALIGGSLTAFGIASALSVWLVSWGERESIPK